MIKPYDELRVTFWTQDNNPIDVSVGTLSLNIQEGIDSWEGDWQQPDAGSFTLVSRNTTLDPLINEQVKFNRRITIHGNKDGDVKPIFIGYITDIFTEYKPNGDSIITIQGTDIIGLFKRTLVDEVLFEYLDDYGPFTFLDFLKGIENYFLAVAGISFTSYFENGENSGGSLGIPFVGYRPAEYTPEIGESILDVFVKFAQTNLDTFISFTGDYWPIPTITIREFYKYNPLYFELLTNPITEYGTNRDFDSVNEPYHGYTNIVVSQNFDKIVNQIYISNTSTSVDPITHARTYTKTSFDPFVLNTSVETNGFSQLSLDTLMPADKTNTTEFERYTRDIFEETAIPKFEVNEITFNFLQRELYEYYCGQIIRVTHKVTPTITIDKLYKIAGINHDINENSWYTTFALKPSDVQRVYDHQQENNYDNASITMNASSGNTNYNFTATLTNFPAGMIDTVSWAILPSGLSDSATLYDASQAGWIYKNNTPRTGNSLTFNFDDDGIFTALVYDAGIKTVAAVITDINGYNFIVKTNISVTAAVVTANFNWTKDAFNGYTFLDASSPDVDTWTWDFGDGTTSTLENPTHYYTSTGNKTVLLTVSNGITTATHSEVVSPSYQRIPVKYIKSTFAGTRTRATSGSPWNKYFITDLRELMPIINVSPKPLYQVSYVARKGTVTLSDGTTTAPSPMTQLSNNQTGSTTTREIVLKPLVTNSGNTEEFDIDFIHDLTLIWNGSNWTTTNNSWGDPFNYRFNLNDYWLYFSNFTTGRTYEPIQVSVSADGITWYSIGNWSITPGSSSQGIWSLDNKPAVMPPIFPS